MGKNNKEIIRFVITGGVCFLIEFVCLVFFRDTIGLPTLVATPYGNDELEMTAVTDNVRSDIFGNKESDSFAPPQ